MITVFPADVTRRRITWLLVVILGALVAGAVLLATYIYQTARPPVFSAAPPVATDRFVRSLYSAGGVDLSLPNDVAVAANGDLYVADTGNARIVVFDRAGKFLRQFGGIVSPTSIAVGPDRVYIIDSAMKRLVIYSLDGKLDKQVTFKEEAPIGVSYTALRPREGRVVVTTKSGVAIGDIDGNFSFAWIHWGSAPTQMDNPALALLTFSDEATSTLYVCDTLNYRVQALTGIETSPTVKWVYGAPLPPTEALRSAGASRKFGLPSGMALLGDGELVVVDGLSSELVVLNARTGAYERTISGMGSADGQLYFPLGVAAGRGEIFVADKYNDRITVLRAAASPKPAPKPRATSRFNPLWLLIVPGLLIAGALVRLLLIRRPRYTLDADFIEALADDPDAGALLITLRRVQIPLQIEPLALRSLPAGLRLISCVAAEASVAAFCDKDPELDELAAAALVVAARGRVRDYFLVGDERARTLAQETRCQVITPEDFLEQAGNTDTHKEDADAGSDDS